MTVVDTLGVRGKAVPRILATDMKARLLTMDQVRDALSTSEPLAQVSFPVGDGVRFRVEPAWYHGIDAVAGDDPVDAFVQIGRGGSSKEYQLTKDSLLEATSICGIPKGYATRTPAKLIEPQINYWFREGFGGKDFKALVVGDEMVKAFTRATINPFSNLRLLDQTLASIQEVYGEGEVLADYKFQHSLRRTMLCLIVPEQMRTIERTGTADDNWSVGIQIKNSLIGEDQTSIAGYLFRWWCTNGAIDTSESSGTWSRRSGGQGDEVYDWARSAVDEVLGGLEHSLDKVQGMVDVPIGGEVNDVLRDIFTTYKVPVPHRQAIIENMVEAGELNMYSIMQAITQAANAGGMDPGHVEDLMRVGGDLPHVAHTRCEACHRLSKD